MRGEPQTECVQYPGSKTELARALHVTRSHGLSIELTVGQSSGDRANATRRLKVGSIGEPQAAGEPLFSSLAWIKRSCAEQAAGNTFVDCPSSLEIGSDSSVSNSQVSDGPTREEDFLDLLFRDDALVRPFRKLQGVFTLGAERKDQRPEVVNSQSRWRTFVALLRMNACCDFQGYSSRHDMSQIVWTSQPARPGLAWSPDFTSRTLSPSTTRSPHRDAECLTPPSISVTRKRPLIHANAE